MGVAPDRKTPVFQPLDQSIVDLMDADSDLQVKPKSEDIAQDLTPLEMATDVGSPDLLKAGTQTLDKQPLSQVIVQAISAEAPRRQYNVLPSSAVQTSDRIREEIRASPEKSGSQINGKQSHEKSRPQSANLFRPVDDQKSKKGSQILGSSPRSSSKKESPRSKSTPPKERPVVKIIERDRVSEPKIPTLRPKSPDMTLSDLVAEDVEKLMEEVIPPPKPITLKPSVFSLQSLDQQSTIATVQDTLLIDETTSKSSDAVVARVESRETPLDTQILGNSSLTINPSDSTVGWKQWRQLLEERFPENALALSKNQHITFTLRYLQENQIPQRRIMVGKQASPGIPPEHWDRFATQFSAEFLGGILPVGSAQQEEILEEGTVVPASPTPVMPANDSGGQTVSLPKPASATSLPVIRPRDVDLTGVPASALAKDPPLPEKKVVHRIPSFDLVATTVGNGADDIPNAPMPDTSLVRYNEYDFLMNTLTRRILTRMMPDYNKQSRDIRLEMKKNVAKYLKNRLGQSGFNSCIMHAKTHDTVFTTFGIPRFLQPEFMEWARQELDRLLAFEVSTQDPVIDMEMIDSNS